MADPNMIWGAKARFTFFSRSIRIRNGYVVEGDISEKAMSSKSFARAVENAACDIAMIVGIENLANIPDDATERFYALSRLYKDQDIHNAIFADIKSFKWQPQFRTLSHVSAKGKDNFKMCSAMISKLSKEQAEKFQFLVIANMTDPDFVAVIPKPYVRLNKGTKNKRVFSVTLGLSIAHTMAASCPLPPELSPFIMPVSYLAEAMENITACVNDTNTEVRNPYTGVLWSRLAGWRPDVAPFSDLLASDSSTEYRIREQLWQAFNHASNATECRIKLPHYFPITSDIRLEHSSGMTVFIDIKVRTIKVTELADGRVKLEHSPRTTIGRSAAIFTVNKMGADYILDLPYERSTKGWLLKREDWPRSFWHRQPPPGVWLTHYYPDSTFLNARTVRLNAGIPALIDDVCSIVCSQGVPQRSTLTPQQVLQFAGPCPPGLMTASMDEDDEDEEDEDIAEALLGTSNEDADTNQDNDESTDADQFDGQDVFADQNGDDEVDVSQDDVGDEDASRGVHNVPPVGTSRFLAMTSATRNRILGGHEKGRTAQLFNRLLTESRQKGEGCPVYLGQRHSFGQLAFILHKWDDNDKRIFDTTGRPPCWIGNISNETPMVNLVQQYSRWRIEYAPLEGTPGEIASITRAQPCLVICQSFPREIDHELQYLWLVPSEFVPKVSLGRTKMPETTSCKCPLFLEGKHSIDRFAVNLITLHATISEFLKGRDTIEVGFDRVQVNPSPYLKNFWEYRNSAENNYERAFSQRRDG